MEENESNVTVCQRCNAVYEGPLSSWSAQSQTNRNSTKGIVLLIIGIASVGTMLLIGMLLKDQGGLRGVFQGKSLLTRIIHKKAQTSCKSLLE
jgi:hypothetical protein